MTANNTFNLINDKNTIMSNYTKDEKVKELKGYLTDYQEEENSLTALIENLKLVKPQTTINAGFFKKAFPFVNWKGETTSLWRLEPSKYSWKKALALSFPGGKYALDVADRQAQTLLDEATRRLEIVAQSTADLQSRLDKMQKFDEDTFVKDLQEFVDAHKDTTGSVYDVRYFMDKLNYKLD